MVILLLVTLAVILIIAISPPDDSEIGDEQINPEWIDDLITHNNTLSNLLILSVGLNVGLGLIMWLRWPQ